MATPRFRPRWTRRGLPWFNRTTIVNDHEPAVPGYKSSKASKEVSMAHQSDTVKRTHQLAVEAVTRTPHGLCL